MIVKLLAAISSPSLPTKSDARRKIASPVIVSKNSPSNSSAASEEKTIGTSCVTTLRPPSLRRARCAAVLPISSAASNLAKLRARSPQ